MKYAIRYHHKPIKCSGILDVDCRDNHLIPAKILNNKWDNNLTNDINVAYLLINWLEADKYFNSEWTYEVIEI